MGASNIKLFKVNNRNTRKRCEICLKLMINTVERRAGGFIVKFEHILHFFSVSIADFEFFFSVNIITQSLR